MEVSEVMMAGGFEEGASGWGLLCFVFLVFSVLVVEVTTPRPFLGKEIRFVDILEKGIFLIGCILFLPF